MRAMIMSAAGLLVLLAFAGSASAQDVNHAIDFTKSCTSPTKIGDPYQCSYTVRNDIDAAQDALTVNGLRDVVHRAAGDLDSGNVFSTLQIDSCTTASGACTQSAATCTGGVGTGTRVDPWVGATSCTLPYGSQLNFHSFSHYTVQPADYGLASHLLKDDAFLTWHDLCNGPVANTNCVADPADAQAGSQTVVERLSSSTSTVIHDSDHQTVATANTGTVVHDFVTVTGQQGYPAATGDVLLEWFQNGDCTGTATTSSTGGPLDLSGRLDAIGFPVFLSSAGSWAFRATYLGDGTYAGSIGGCESLTVSGPTAAQVASSRATLLRQGALVRWRMGSEIGVLGYNVYRERRGARVRLNRASIAARGGVGGRSYSYLDRSAPRAHHGTRYWLQVVNLDGSRLWKAVRLR